MLKPIIDNIPIELKQLPQWVCWKAEPGKDGKLTKVPYNPKTGGKAMSNNSATWGTFEQAISASENGNGYAGIGIVPAANDRLIVVDIDGKIDLATGEINPEVLAEVQALNTYSEVSPSGTGIHCYLYGKLPPKDRKNGEFEVYERGKFLTFTGHQLPGTPATVEHRQAEIEDFHTKYIARDKKPPERQRVNNIGVVLEDAELLSKARKAKNGALFDKLWSGDWTGYPSQSEADLAFCNMLAFWTGKDPDQMDRLFRMSGLYRAKNDRHPTYLHDTIQKAIDDCDKVYSERTTAAEDFGELDWEGNLIDKPRQIAGLKPGDFTDVGQARVLARVNGNNLRFTMATNYLVYDGRAWDESGVKAHELAQQLTEQQLAEARGQLAAAQEAENTATENEDDEAKKEAHLAVVSAKAYRNYVLTCRKTSKIAAALKEAQPMLAIKVDELDSDPFLLNTPGGTVDLKTGEIKKHDPYDLCTKITTVSPGNKGAELFADFLNVITCGDRDLENYLQLVAGMAAIGKVFSELLTIAYGGGRNGKSTFFNLLARVLGNYAGLLSAEFLTINNRQNKKPEFAELRGRRLVIAGELEEGMRLNTATVKKLCSTDLIRAEKKYKDPFDFIPSHTIVLFTNHLPKVGTSDAGTWRRLVVVPFNAVIEGDPVIQNYADYLFDNAGESVLSWVIEGAARFIQDGYKIDPPECVKQAISEYRQSSDWLNHFLTERCEIDSRYTERSGNLYYNYREYCTETGEYTRSAADFKTALINAGYEQRKTKRGAFVYGLRLRPDFQQWGEGRENPHGGRVWAAGKF